MAFLDWIRPTDNNAQLSKKFRKVLQRIIDTVFDSLQPMHTGSQTEQLQPLDRHQDRHNFGHQQPEDQIMSSATTHQSDIHPLLTTIDDIDWFNTLDWTQGDWLEQNNQFSQY